MNLTILKAWLQAKFNSDERGAALVEYSLVVVFIALVCMIGMSFIGTETNSKFDEIGSKL